MTYESSLQALSDPTRRAIIEKLRLAPLPVGRLASEFPISRPAVSQHLKVLSDAGLVIAEQQGARRVYRLAPSGIRDLRSYLDSLWDDALAAYAAEAQSRSKGDTR